MTSERSIVTVFFGFALLAVPAQAANYGIENVDGIPMTDERVLASRKVVVSEG